MIPAGRDGPAGRGRVTGPAAVTSTDRGVAVRWRGRVVLPALAALAATLVFGNGLGRLPLWRDEVASVDIATRPVPAILVAAGRIDVVHTAYYLLLHGVVALGRSEALIRFPSLLAAVATVTVVVALARSRLGSLPAVVAGALLIGNPWLAAYAREARPYAPATAFVCAAAAVLLGGPPSRRRVIAFTALAVVATWLHLFDVLPLVGLVLGCLAVDTAHRSRPIVGAWLGCAIAGAVATAPLAVLAARESGQVSWITAPTGDDVQRLLADVAGSGAAEPVIAALLLGAAASTAASWWSRSRGRGAADAVAGLGAGVARSGDGVVAEPTSARRGAPTPAAPARVGPAAFVPAVLGAVAGPAVLLGVSSWGVPLYVERYVLVSTPLLALAAAVALLPGAAPAGRATVRAGIRVLVAAAVVVVALMGLPAAAAGPADKTEDLRAGAGFLAAHAQPGDCVAYAPGWARVGVDYYLRRTSAQLHDIALDPARPVVGLFPDEFPLAGVEAQLLACRRVWVVGYPGPVGRWRPVPEVTTSALAAVAPDFTASAPTAFGDLTAALWTARSRGGG